MRRLIGALLLCALAAPAIAAQPLTTPTLPSVDNFRDLAGISAAAGGTGQPDAAGHGTLRPGIVYRANVLTLSPADQVTLVKLGIAEDIDLRTPAEIKHQPDNLPRGIAFLNVNIVGVPSLPRPDTSSAAAAAQAMEGYYRDFVTSARERAEIRIALLDVASAKTPVVIHCSAGKDRTGWVSAILQNIAGVSPAVIMQDYLASNRYTAPVVQAMLAHVPVAQRPAYAVLLSVQPQFLNAAETEVTQDYGGMLGYLTKGLGLTQADIAALRLKLVEAAPDEDN